MSCVIGSGRGSRPTGHAAAGCISYSRRPCVALGEQTGPCADYRWRSLTSARTVTATSATQPNAAAAATITLTIDRVDAAFLLSSNS